jgi:hypothetical protein
MSGMRFGRRINTTAFRKVFADPNVIQTDQCREHADGEHKPKRTVHRQRKRDTDDVGFARAPIAIQQGGRAFPIDIARTLNVVWYQLVRLKRGASRDEASQPSRSRVSRHALLFNDADEVSCRAGAIKCSRCRASFAPIRTRFRLGGIWFPR